MTVDIQLTEWYLVRHAPVKNSRKGIYRDANASAELPGQAIINALAAQLPDGADWYVSPLTRTRETAKALLDANSNNSSMINYADGLKEQDFGAWQGLTFEEIWAEIEGLPPHKWSLLAAETKPPKGESFEAVYARILEFMKQTVQTNPGRAKVIVSHAGIIRAFVGVALGLTADKALALDAKPFSLTRLLHQTGKGKGGEWQLQCLNQRFDHS